MLSIVDNEILAGANDDGTLVLSTQSRAHGNRHHLGIGILFAQGGRKRKREIVRERERERERAKSRNKRSED